MIMTRPSGSTAEALARGSVLYVVDDRHGRNLSPRPVHVAAGDIRRQLVPIPKRAAIADDHCSVGQQERVAILTTAALAEGLIVPACQVPPKAGEKFFLEGRAELADRCFHCARNWLRAAGLFLKYWAVGTDIRGGGTLGACWAEGVGNAASASV